MTFCSYPVSAFSCDSLIQLLPHVKNGISYGFPFFIQNNTSKLNLYLDESSAMTVSLPKRKFRNSSLIYECHVDVPVSTKDNKVKSLNSFASFLKKALRAEMPTKMSSSSCSSSEPSFSSHYLFIPNSIHSEQSDDFLKSFPHINTHHISLNKSSFVLPPRPHPFSILLTNEENHPSPDRPEKRMDDGHKHQPDNLKKDENDEDNVNECLEWIGMLSHLKDDFDDLDLHPQASKDSSITNEQAITKGTRYILKGLFDEFLLKQFLHHLHKAFQEDSSELDGDPKLADQYATIKFYSRSETSFLDSIKADQAIPLSSMIVTTPGLSSDPIDPSKQSSPQKSDIFNSYEDIVVAFDFALLFDSNEIIQLSQLH
ncbi:uncharacterized protein MONOS_9468 [Monocercomonoides exilis]|uniref:uncharacterized protein n=1 Tax=Monocercomonoides exilis TaxID=2049356 RepID=UPI0035598E26|nr:hypothetical protein MONOS_9468 [Monocercomonoides exilis]|eukprot:MONOS_9468.1-p1 / transcript=MONOS_9468.1 / gene=MONOS_9468 / organism=Monocercomonoides_exilis_PA203 / gene_product=unspecified product / transcript_product=unspecified product / location=Mono_scaffold00392:36267-37511(-) / protein_length=371 / sequence_SO=supercontig / SO=protein_coding / is_pseudo=false